MRGSPFGVGVVVVSLGVGCGLATNPPPTDRAVFPTGLAVSADGDFLIVVSSDFDFAFDAGSVLVADLAAARRGLTGPDAVVDDAFVSQVTVPPLGDRPVFDASGQHLFLTTKGLNQLHQINFDDGQVSCGGQTTCGLPPFVIQLANNDPYDVVLVNDAGTRGLVTHLSSNEAEFFSFNPDDGGAARLQVESETVLFEETVTGVRSAVFRPASDDNDAQIFVALEHRFEDSFGVEIGVFEVPGVNRADDVNVTTIDVTALTGSVQVRSLALVPDEVTGGVAVVAALRFPDALARFSFDDAQRRFKLTALSETCELPTNFAFVAGAVDEAGAPVGPPRLLLTCTGGQVVSALDPLTLAVRDSVRFFGRDPFDVVVDLVNQQAFVSFFLDNSIGVLSLDDDRLTPIGRIGTPLPPPQDGRE